MQLELRAAKWMRIFSMTSVVSMHGMTRNVLGISISRPPSIGAPAAHEPRESGLR